MSEHALGRSREDIIAANLAAVEAHFHNENPENVDKAIALYGPEITWEAPSRGQIYTDPDVVRSAYLDIFKSVQVHKQTTLRRFATEEFVFDDQVADITIVDDLMPNLPYPSGTRISVRLVHLFEMKDGKIAREIAYEMWREFGSPEDNDAIPEDAVVVDYDAEAQAKDVASDRSH